MTRARIRPLAVLIALALLVAPPAADAQAVGRGTPPAVPPSATTQPGAPAVTELNVNGLKVLVKRRESSQTAVAGLFIKGGAANITAANAGIESLMLDAAPEATANFPREAMRRELAKTAASINGFAGIDFSVLTMAAPRDSFEESWRLFTDVVLRPTFAAADVERVRGRQLAAAAAREDSPEAFVDVLLTKNAFAGHPYANSPNGTVDSLRGISVDAIKRYHQQLMVTSRLLLVIVGNIDVQAARRMVETAFGRLPRGTYTAPTIPQLALREPAVTAVQRDLQTTYLEGLFAAPPPTSPDIYPMRVAIRLLQEAVFEEVRTRRNLSYAPDAFVGSRIANTGGLSASTTDVNRTVQVMLDEVSRLQQREVPVERLRALAQSFLTTSFLDQETNSSQAGQLAAAELTGLGWQESERLLERVRAVTPADVQRVANTYMRNLQFVVLGQTANLDRGLFTRTLP